MILNFIKKHIFPFQDYNFRSFSLSLLLVAYALGFIGVYLINILDDTGENLFMKQILGFAAGLFFVILISLVDYHLWGKLFIILYIVGIALLLICKYSNSLPIYGWSHYDARRWIKIGGDPTAGEKNNGFEFMPSEITKITFIIFFAKFFSIAQKYIKKIWVLGLAIVFMFIPAYMIFDQPDLSTTVVVVTVFAIMVLISGVPYKFIVPIIAIAVPALIGFFWYIQQEGQKLLTEWQLNRINSALHPEDYPELRYQQDNALAAIKQGNMLGKTLTKSEALRGTRLVPVVESDFIFTAVAEEFGFIGSLAVLILFLIMILLIIRIARRATDKLGTMMAVGFGALILTQVFINIGVVTSLLPNTGIPLPFMSSGLSALLVNLGMLGILLNISIQTKAKEVSKAKEEKDDLGFIDV